MKKGRNGKQSTEPSDEMLPEYRFDYSKARPNRFAGRMKEGSSVIAITSRQSAEEKSQKQSTRQKGLGTRRYIRYVAAFDRVIQCIDAGYFLEAIAIIDSLLWDRLASRLGYRIDKEVSARLSCGQLCGQLLGSDDKGVSGKEQNRDFQAVIKDIRDWVKRRNVAMHATAKILHSQQAPEDFGTVLLTHRQDAIAGVKLLRRFDLLDTSDRASKNKRPATSPNAFFPEKRHPESATRFKHIFDSTDE